MPTTSTTNNTRPRWPFVDGEESKTITLCMWRPYNGWDLYRITSLGRIVGSTHRKHSLEIRKNLKIIYNMHVGCIYNCKKKSAQNIILHLEKQKKTNLTVNSVRSSWIVFHTIHMQVYHFLFSKCMSNLKLQIFGLAYVDRCLLSFFQNIWTCFVLQIIILIDSVVPKSWSSHPRLIIPNEASTMHVWTVIQWEPAHVRRRHMILKIRCGGVITCI
jgi:hypothetical protein